MEEFKTIPNFSKYEINKEGIIINKETGNKICVSVTKGYLACMLTNDIGERTRQSQHRILMLTFKPIENAEKFQVDHIDCNKLNNNLDNLEWVTPKENTHRAIKNGLYKNNRKEISDEIVEKIRKEYIPGVNGNYKKLLEKYNLKKSMFFYIIKGDYRKDSPSTIEVNKLVKVKKTRCTGEDSGTAKLNEEKVKEIKKLLSENKLTQSEIGIKYNVSHRTISNIKIGKSWGHVV